MIPCNISDFEVSWTHVQRRKESNGNTLFSGNKELGIKKAQADVTVQNREQINSISIW